MHQIVALADEDVRQMLRAISADVQASLALSRATLQAVAALSQMASDVADDALSQEIDLAQRLTSPDRMIAVLEEARVSLAGGTEDDLAAMSALERALHAAADALPDLDVVQPEAARASARR